MSNEPNGTSLLSETAAAHVRAIEQMQSETAAAKAQVLVCDLAVAKMQAKLDLQHETIELLSRQLQFYQNFGVALSAKLDAIMALCADSIESARAIGGAPATLPPSADDEARLKDLHQRLNPEEELANG